MNQEQTTVLFVDDEQHILSALKRNLLREPYRKLFANSAGEALQYFEKETVGVVVCDMKMPHMSGLELLRRIKVRSPETVRLVLSGFTEVEQLIGCINSGEIYRYLTKSFDLDSFKQTIQDAINCYQDQQIQKHQIDNLSMRYKKIEQILKKQQQATDELLRASSLDILTTIPNRQSFNQLADHELAMARRTRSPLSLMLIDIDALQRVESDNSLVSSEMCLQKIAWALRKTLRRPVDIIARFDEQKFAVVLPGTKPEGAVKVAERVLKKVRELEFSQPDEESRLVLTLSIGLVCKKPALEDIEVKKFVSTASMALYAAQKSGGDCWIDMSAELDAALH